MYSIGRGVEKLRCVKLRTSFALSFINIMATKFLQIWCHFRVAPVDEIRPSRRRCSRKDFKRKFFRVTGWQTSWFVNCCCYISTERREIVGFVNVSLLYRFVQLWQAVVKTNYLTSYRMRNEFGSAYVFVSPRSFQNSTCSSSFGDVVVVVVVVASLWITGIDPK